MFGRKRAAQAAEDLDEDLVDDAEYVDDDLNDLDEGGEDADAPEGEDKEDDADERELDEWDRIDASQDWRDDGPFDAEEVDLDGDTVARLDFGSLVLTPREGMQLQLQVDQTSGQVQTALVTKGNSGLEIALFAAPRGNGLAKEVRDEMLRAAGEAGGQAEFAAGPFGTEVRRQIPVQGPDGQDAVHLSRTWLAEGPRWLLRGVLMGEACLTDDPAASQDFVEFFKNIVVKRGTSPMPSGELVPMSLPEGVVSE